MLRKIRKSKFVKVLSVYVALSFMVDIFRPNIALALTGGPSQPEVSSFQPVETSEMVDIFSGDFAYNIPLLDVGGYPVNMSYSSGIAMDQEASWTGLGWNINVGAITRAMRGIPDDFKADEIKKQFNVRANQTFGANIMVGDIEIIGSPLINLSLGVGFGMFYNNYKGVGYELTLDPNLGIGDKQKGSLNIGLGLSANSQEGIGVNPSVGISVNTTKMTNNDAGSSALSAKVGAPYNSRSGMKSLSLGIGLQTSQNTGKTVANKKGQLVAQTGSTSRNGGATIPIGSQSYIPQMTFPMRNISVTVNAGLGGEVKWVNGKARFSAYYNEQRLMYKSKSYPAYGYMYAGAGQRVRNGIHDFNREKEGSFTKNTPGLPLTSFTYDIYNVAGQGIAGMYRPFRSDVGTVYDNSVFSMSFGGQIGVDFGGGDVVKGGANFGTNFNFSISGNWTGGKNVDLSFKESVSNYDRFEPYYFKQAGELVAVDENFYAKLGGTKPVKIRVNENGTESILSVTNRNGSESPLLPPTYKTKRDKRNQVTSLLTVEEAKDFALSKKIESYSFVDESKGTVSITEIDRDAIGQPHHISEMSVLRPDGSRYVFGIPAYNLKQKEVTFNVAGRSHSCVDGQVTYVPNGDPDKGDNSIDNEQGQDWFFTSTELPPYAHSYLLTAVLSADYVDRTGDGPTDDDLGKYTKFNYTQVHDPSDPYHWRVPWEENKANFNEGFKSDPLDDKGSYVYGTKEIWHLLSIETKTYIAEFTLKDREDGYGVADEEGADFSSSVGKKMKRLEKISLFAKWDRQTNEENAEPIKVVHFEYDYSLCPNVHNNSGDPVDVDGNTVGVSDPANVNVNEGKLTLKKVFFTYGSSLRGKLSPYEFVYADPDHNGSTDVLFNPDYNLKGFDRWGNFKPNNATSCNVATDPLSNSDDPYVGQDDKALADRYASAWSLSTIQLPSGGTINIDYESDDYAFVQNRRAMQMVDIVGMGFSDDPLLMDSLNLFNGPIANRYMKFDLPADVISRDDFKKKYLVGANGKQITSLYFKFLIDVIGLVSGKPPDVDDPEFVSGYADIASFGVVGTTPHSQAWIELKSVNLKDKSDDKDVHPIAKAAWQFARLHLSRILYSGVEPEDDSEGELRGILAMKSDITAMFKGFNKMLRDWKFGQNVFPDKSWIRLYSPTYQKFGGGVRVKRLTLDDKWSGMGGVAGDDFEYGQEYEYTTTLQGSVTATNPNGIPISSGVAAYEPMIGNEENPFRQPVSYTNEHRLAPDDEFYQETPYGESFFPNASVGYSVVRVRNLARTNVKRTATGFVQHEFYTAKDFPVYTRITRMERKHKKPSWLTKILKVDVKDYMTASQGYSIELNNMHGQMKAKWVYPEVPDGTPLSKITPISGAEYFYNTQPNNSKRLRNKVSVIQPDGIISERVVGLEIDLVADMRENSTFTSGFSITGNLDVSLFPVPPPPILIPSVWPMFTKEETRFRSAVMTKVITRYGILKKTVMYDLGSRVSTENLAFDGETGEVLLTRSRNDFEDPVFSFTYPAHWGYDRMGMAYQNIGLTFDVSSISSGTVNITNAAAFFTVGDELLNSSGDILWVVEVNSGNIKVIDRANTSPVSIPGSSTIKIIRSGRRNMQTLPMGTVTSLDNPTDGVTKLNLFKNVLEADAIEYSDDWDNFCECGFAVPGQASNAFIEGEKGNFRAQKALLFLTPRLQSNVNRNTNIRHDGIYKNFTPFWTPPVLAGAWNDNPSNWTFTSEVTVVSPFGVELETRDALGRHSAVQFGFDNTLPTAVASNAEYREIGFESFEDYGCKTCLDDHFSFSKSSPAAVITNTESHTGRNCIKLTAGKRVEIVKIIVACP